MKNEIERKFLVKGEFKSMAFAHNRIMQGYLCSSPGRSVRIRIYGEKGLLTIKGGRTNTGMTCLEWEKEIPVEEAEALMQLCLPGRIEKVRYLIKDGQHIFEVDEFYGENKGLIMAEVELSSEDEAIETPEFLGEEVTGDPRFYNSYLAQHPFTQWNNKT